jgi:catechol 2,3-dioxygenase-like lactoylglutathione lyase family enzyme
MTTTLLGLRTVIYPVADLVGAKQWWADLLGFAPYFDEPFYVGFDVGGYELGLLPQGEPTDGALTYWGVDDVDAAVADALARGASVPTAAAVVGAGIVTATVTSPQGLVVGFIRNPNFAAR